jgi:hypothetical protein
MCCVCTYVLISAPSARLLDPTPAAPIGFLKDLRALVESRVAARDAPHEPSTQITEERYHYNGR